jgi:hypothetical protein
MTMSRQRRISAIGGISFAITALAAAGVLAQNAPATLTVTIKGSSTYAQPTPVPVKTALLIVTPHWEDVTAVTPTGGREASGQPLFMSDLVVAISNMEMDCAAAFKPKLSSPADFFIAAGKAEAYIPSNGWQSTSLGKLLTGDAAERTIEVDRFSMDAQFTASKKKMVSKDGVHGSDGHLTITQKENEWTVDFMVKADDLTAEGTLPLTSCGITSRRKAEWPPLLQERRLLTAADKYGM